MLITAALWIVAAVATGVCVVCGVAALCDVIDRQRDHAAARRSQARLRGNGGDGDPRSCTGHRHAGQPADSPTGVRAFFARPPLRRPVFSTMLGHTRLWRLYHRTLTRAGLNAHAEAWAQWYVLGALLLLLTASAASSPALAVILLAALTVTLAMLLSGAVDRAHQQLREQLPQMLDALVAALRAGLSFPQAIDTVTADTQGRMHEILQNLQADLAVGRDLGRAFQAAATASELREFTFVATAAAVVSRVGGDAPQLFENCAALVRQDLALNRSLKAQTAQGRLSVRMIAIVPAILIAIMSCAMPGYLGVWLHSTVGRVAFAFALLLLLTGFLWVRRVVRVDV